MLACFGLSVQAFAQKPASGAKKPEEAPRILAFPADGALTRKNKKVASVKRGTFLEVNDSLAAGKKNPCDVAFGKQMIARIKAQAEIDVKKLDPLYLAWGGDNNVDIKIKKGAVQFRAAEINKKSKVQTSSGGVNAQVRGTAYQVKVTGDTTEIIVAEGSVFTGPSSSDPEAYGTIVEAGEKLTVVEGGPFPEPVPVTAPADLNVIYELFALTSTTLEGYSRPATLAFQDSSTLYIADVKFPSVEMWIDINDYSGPPTVAERPNSNPRNIVFASEPIAISTVDNAGNRKVIAKDLRLEAVSLNGQKIYGTNPELGLFVVNFDGSGRTLLSKEKFFRMSLADDGRRLMGVIGEEKGPSSKKWDPKTRQFDYDAANYTTWVPAVTSAGIINSNGTGFKRFGTYPKNSFSLWPQWRKAGSVAYALIINDVDEDSFRIVHADPATPRVLGPFESDETYALYVSPLAKYVYAQKRTDPAGEQTVENWGSIIRLTDGAVFKLPDGYGFESYLPSDTKVELSYFSDSNAGIPNSAWDPTEPVTALSPTNSRTPRYPNNGNPELFSINATGTMMAYYERNQSRRLKLSDPQDMDPVIVTPYTFQYGGSWTWSYPIQVRWMSGTRVYNGFLPGDLFDTGLRNAELEFGIRQFLVQEPATP